MRVVYLVFTLISIDTRAIGIRSPLSDATLLHFRGNKTFSQIPNEEYLALCFPTLVTIFAHPVGLDTIP